MGVGPIGNANYYAQRTAYLEALKEATDAATKAIAAAGTVIAYFLSKSGQSTTIQG